MKTPALAALAIIASALTADWPHTRAQIIDAFDGELPGSHLEAELVDLYEANPSAVINAINSVATSLKNGRINSGWAVLKTAAAKKAVAQTNPTVTREKLIRNADQWLRNAGLMYDRWDEVHDELFGDRGRLASVRSDKLVERYHDAWTSLRPDGEQVEAEELERAQQWIATRGNVTQTTQRTAVQTPVCSKCGFTTGHAEDCELVLKYATITPKVTA